MCLYNVNKQLGICNTVKNIFVRKCEITLHRMLIKLLFSFIVEHTLLEPSILTFQQS